MLYALVLLPLVGAPLLLLVPSTTHSGLAIAKQLALTVSLVVLGLSLYLLTSYDLSLGGYQWLSGWSLASFPSLHVGVDGLSLSYVVLTTFLTPVCLLASWYDPRTAVSAYLATLLTVEGLLLGVFVSLDLLSFYVCFEAVLIPLFLLVGVWGGSPTRVRSAMLLFLYTLTGSLCMLLAVLYLRIHVGSTDYLVITQASLDPLSQRLMWWGFWVALMTKTPMVPLHVWLPRAHADAPLAGSMLLAGVVLKLATYGIVRVLLGMLPDATAHYTPLVQALGVVSVAYASLATVRAVDLKQLVAYSSVAHMGVVVLGLFSNTLVGIEGALLLSLAHGVVSPLLFQLVGGTLYQRYHTRSLRYYRGLGLLMPLFSLCLFLASAANMGVPLTGNWIAEVMSLTGTFMSSPVSGSLGALGILLSACYSMWLWTRLVGGSWSPYLGGTYDLTRREVHLITPLLVVAFWLGIAPNASLDLLHGPVTLILTS